MAATLVLQFHSGLKNEIYLWLLYTVVMLIVRTVGLC